MTTSQIKSGGELKACPFCGGEAHLVSRPPRIPFVECRICCIEQAGTTEADAIAAWNSRTPSHGRVSGEVLERLRIMSKQKLTSEMDVEMHDGADFEGAYEWFCSESRAIFAALSTPTEDAAPVAVGREVTDRQAAEDAFDAILGDAGSYAEWGSPSYKENAIRTLTEHIATHRLTFSRGVDGEAAALRIAWWNDMRDRGVSQDIAIAKINAALSSIKEPRR